MARPTIIIATVCAAAFAGCGGPATVERDELEQQVQTELGKSVGQKAPKATCPDELKAEKGEKTRCSMTFPDGKLGIGVEVTKVDGDNVRFSIEADQQLQK